VIDSERLTAHRSLGGIAAKVFGGQRITVAEGLQLYEEGELGFVGSLADGIRRQKHGNRCYFNHNIHIEPTNVCVFDCKFCSYSRLYKQRDQGWELTANQMLDRVRAYDGRPLTEVHIVGGVHPKMDIHFFGGLLRSIREHRPDLHIKAFTAVELDYMIRKAKMTYEEGLGYLIDCGLGSLPGGGAEVFDENVRARIAADKCSSENWLEIHRTAHRLGLKSNATMLYGHVESYAHRIDHMQRLRDLQDETGGFNAFIPLKFRNKDNQMSDVAETTHIEDLRNYAISRIYLDNFDHIKSYWPMIGRFTAQLSLDFGVNDLDGTIDDTTKIYSMAGAEEQHPSMTTDEICTLIWQMDREPVERDTLYNVIRRFKAPVTDTNPVAATAVALESRPAVE
jgi:aminodeoxyfutalosine synthase